MTKKFYAYHIPGVGAAVTDDWNECERMVLEKKGARFKKFSNKEEAEAWLRAGALYLHKPTFGIHHQKIKNGIYFDSGTGRGLNLIEVKVADQDGTSQLEKILPAKEITKFGTYVILSRRATNNYGELLALKFALQIARTKGIKVIGGDSKLVIDHWSKGNIKKNEFPRSYYTLVNEVVLLRKRFEENGGTIFYISGDKNPADLGFHR